MGQVNLSTPQHRTQWVAFMLVYEGKNGIVTSLSREVHLSRQTLHGWSKQTHAALLATFNPPEIPTYALVRERYLMRS